MRQTITLCLVSALVVLAGCCGSGGCGVAKSPRMRAPTAYGSASGTARVVYERSPSVVVRETARPASTYERRVRSFTPPAAPVIPTARKVATVRTAPARAASPRRVYPAPAPDCEPAPRRAPDPCEPDPCDPCAGGNCGIPSLDDCCPGGNCGIPSLGDLLNPCK